MNKQRWKQIDDIVAGALELKDAEREKFVSEKCLHDEDLQKQVLAMLTAEKESDDFMANSAINVIAKAIANDSTTLFSNSLYNKKLGNYKVISLLGAGGMGEVYLAQDENLNRKVALKVLPNEFLDNDERVKRFESEARAIAALNHPNIVTIYDFGKFEDVNFIATEYVEGETVRELIKENLPLKKTLSIILQILDALSSAHNAGIIHRDIKPENIMVRPDGYVKILDFGLVKLVEDNIDESGNIAKTMEGVVIGTPAYMSPNQASGEKVDHRTDLWSLALVFYEMLAKENPFKQKSNKQTIQAILSKDAPLISSNDSTIPPEIERILDKALEKDIDMSYQTASDFAADLKRIKRDIDSSPSWDTDFSTQEKLKETNQKTYVPYLIGAVALILIGIGIWFFAIRNQTVNDNEWEKAKVVQLTERRGIEHFPTLSPDGKTFVYASDENGKSDIFVRRVGSKKGVNLTSDPDADDTQPSFSPDGNFLAFRSNRENPGIYVMEVTGENPRRITDFGFLPSWSPDGKQLAVSEKSVERPSVKTRSSVWIIDIVSGDKRKLVGGHANQPTWAPNGQRIAFWFIGSGGRRDVATISVEGGEPKSVTNSANTNWNPVWSPDGKYLYYSSDRSGNMSFWRIRINQSTGNTVGKAELVPTPAKFNAHLSFSKDGKKLIYDQTITQANIGLIEFDEKLGKTKGDLIEVTSGDYEFNRPILSPNNEQFVVLQKKATQDDIIVLDRDGTNRRDLTDDLHFDRYPRWSPDGNRIAIASDRGGTYDIWSMQKDGTNLQQITFKAFSSFPVWAPNGDKLAYSSSSQTYIVDLTKDFQKQTPQTLSDPEDKKGFITWDWSSDGTKLAGIYHRKDGWSGVGYYSFESKKYEKLDEVIAFPYWMPNSRQIIYSVNNKIYLVDIISKERREIFSLPENNITNASISSDGKLLYFVVYTSESNIWLLDNSEQK